MSRLTFESLVMLLGSRTVAAMPACYSNISPAASLLQKGFTYLDHWRLGFHPSFFLEIRLEIELTSLGKIEHQYHSQIIASGKFFILIVKLSSLFTPGSYST